ncbi:unnamed protein product [Ambrosiozyma monospora]|uniref:Unnamed protein product n=1 Tax=Ambrosiozyma monospora TaxID=43982 RepID=A0A9W6Z653_AMBMO|nr:unnamed protein product [Ambrosiozyma monospora]
MSNKIRKLSNALSQTLQSAITLQSIQDIIRELIQNGVDALATEIELKLVYTGESINVEYLDNGVGIDPDSLEKLGERFHTSKIAKRHHHQHHRFTNMNVDTISGQRMRHHRSGSTATTISSYGASPSAVSGGTVGDNGSSMSSSLDDGYGGSGLGTGVGYNEEDGGLELLKDVTTFGFRGESMNSIIKMASSTRITSKRTDYNSAFSIMFIGSHRAGSCAIMDNSSTAKFKECETLRLFL